MITGVIGARIWYVIFMWNELYANNPLEEKKSYFTPYFYQYFSKYDQQTLY